MCLIWLTRSKTEFIVLNCLVSYSNPQWDTFLLDYYMWWLVDCVWSSDDDQLGGWTETMLWSTSQIKLAPKEVMVTVVWPITAFWTQWQKYDIWEVWSILKIAMSVAEAGKQKGPNSPWQFSTICPTNNAPKIEQIRIPNFVSPIIFIWPLSSQLPLLQVSQLSQLFARRILPQPARWMECFPRVHYILKYGFLWYWNKQIYLMGKNTFIVMVSVFIHKDVSEPSYNE